MNQACVSHHQTAVSFVAGFSIFLTALASSLSFCRSRYDMFLLLCLLFNSEIYFILMHFVLTKVFTDSDRTSLLLLFSVSLSESHLDKWSQLSGAAEKPYSVSVNLPAGVGDNEVPWDSVWQSYWICKT